MSGFPTAEDVGQIYQKTHHGDHPVVKLLEVKRSKVLLENTENQCLFHLSLAKFMKFYSPLRKQPTSR